MLKALLIICNIHGWTIKSINIYKYYIFNIIIIHKCKYFNNIKVHET